MIILRIDLEGFGDEFELLDGLAKDRDKQAPVMPDLVGLEMDNSELVHELEFVFEIRRYGDEGFVSQLPGKRSCGWTRKDG